MDSMVLVTACSFLSSEASKAPAADEAAAAEEEEDEEARPPPPPPAAIFPRCSRRGGASRGGGARDEEKTERRERAPGKGSREGLKGLREAGERIAGGANRRCRHGERDQRGGDPPGEVMPGEEVRRYRRRCRYRRRFTARPPPPPFCDSPHTGGTRMRAPGHAPFPFPPVRACAFATPPPPLTTVCPPPSPHNRP